MSGTEVPHSCQRVDGSPHLNQGLLGYLLDGKNRLLAVKDKRGKLLARASLAFYGMEPNQSFFLERLYTHGNYETQCRQAIANMALRKAHGLQLEVTVTKGSGYAEGDPSSTDLHSLAIGVGYEYSDAMLGVRKDGIYTIPKANLVCLKII